MRFELFTTMTIKIPLLWGVTPFNLVIITTAWEEFTAKFFRTKD
jgi:hypothetical protein